MARLFVAVWPPPAVVDALVALPRERQPRLRWTTEDQWHVTLGFLGEADEADAATALDTVVHPAVTATLGPALHHLGAGALVFPVSGLDSVAAAVAGATSGVGTSDPERVFRGHLTLARVKDRARVIPAHLEFIAAWLVTAVTLVRSNLHRDGARYDVVHSVALIEQSSPQS